MILNATIGTASAPAVPEMRFTDSHGTHRGRDGNGQLHRLDHRRVRRKPSADRGEDSARDDSQWEEPHARRTREGSRPR